MIIDVLVATLAVALLSVVGVLFFGSDRRLVGLERYVIPMAVGVFLALILVELIPETLAESPQWGGVAIGVAFILVYVMAHTLHVHLHKHENKHNEKEEAALLVLFGDALHNFADGVLIAGSFLLAPEIGWAVTAAVMVHELPQEIVEFGVLLRAGYSRKQALVRNFFSATTVILGGLFALWFAGQFSEWMWMVTAFVAGNMLYIAASELLPKLHGSAESYGNFAGLVAAVALGFAIMTFSLTWSHEHIMPESMHEHELEEQTIPMAVSDQVHAQ